MKKDVDMKYRARGIVGLSEDFSRFSVNIGGPLRAEFNKMPDDTEYEGLAIYRLLGIRNMEDDSLYKVPYDLVESEVLMDKINIALDFLHKEDGYKLYNISYG